MIRLGAILRLTLTVGLWALPAVLWAQQQQQSAWVVESLAHEIGGYAEYDLTTGRYIASNNVVVTYGTAVLTANYATVNTQTGEVTADGRVRIQEAEQIWASEHVRYNFFTHQMTAEQFRTGQPPMFAEGKGLSGEVTNRTYVATDAVITSDDVAQPLVKVRAKRIKLIPGRKIEAYHATLYVGNIPIFYFPYYSRNLTEHAGHFNFLPGYRTAFGPFLLTTYTWWLNEELDGAFHLDYRGKRGPGVGPDLNYHLGNWGSGTLKYYYTHDNEPDQDQLGVNIPENRQRVWFSYESNPATNLYIKSLVRYETDLAVVRDFFEGEYRRDPQPDTFVEVNKFWHNFSIDAYVQPRVNEFLETVERLPDIRLTGYRQEIGATPLYYESESSAGYYKRAFAVNAGINGPPPGLNYEAARADTYHQILLPETFFGWLNVTPRVGGRFTYYSEASGPGATTDEQYRGVFNTGAEISFKASRLWPGVENKFFEVDGLRHIIQPSANYVFVPSPSVAPNQLPQFDYELPSLRLLPIEFPDYNAIDSIDSQNAIRWGLHNKLQTKRDGQVVNLVDWNVYTDWRIKPRSDQTTFSDLYSDLYFRPRSWLGFESLVRYDIAGHDWRMSYTTINIRPNSVWSWSVGHYFLRDDFSTSPLALGPGNNVLSSTMFYRLNENWGLRMAHYFNARTGTMQEQSYSVYRDLRSWTAALSLRVRQNVGGPEDYTVAFTFSLKAFPHYGQGGEATGAYSLLGG
jgi:lipopolysaccharide assembly outer membrane protein LptD (OstA)